MSIQTFLDFTPSAFWNAVDGYLDEQIQLDRRQWEKTRWQTGVLLNVQLPKNKTVKLNKLLPFDWEKTETNKDLKTYEETLALMEKIEKRKKAK